MAIALLAPRSDTRCQAPSWGLIGGGGVVVTGASRRLGFPSPVRESEEENVPYGEMEFVICEADSFCFFFLYFFFFILHTS